MIDGVTIEYHLVGAKLKSMDTLEEISTVLVEPYNQLKDMGVKTRSKFIWYDMMSTLRINIRGKPDNIGKALEHVYGEYGLKANICKPNKFFTDTDKGTEIAKDIAEKLGARVRERKWYNNSNDHVKYMIDEKKPSKKDWAIHKKIAKAITGGGK